MVLKIVLSNYYVYSTQLNKKMRNKLTLEKCVRESLKYNSRVELKNNNCSVYHKIIKMGWQNKCFSHMKILWCKKWDKESCINEALKYSYRSHFERKSGSAYVAARINGWLNECCSHMQMLGDKYKRLIYVFEFSNKSAYIGLTSNFEYRIKTHTEHQVKRKNSSVYKYIVKTNLPYTIKKLTEYIDVDLSIIKESEFIEKYRNDGWNIINIAKAGSIGSNLKWNKDKVINEVKKYNSISEFRKKSSGAWDAARRNGWLIDCENTII